MFEKWEMVGQYTPMYAYKEWILETMQNQAPEKKITLGETIGAMKICQKVEAKRLPVSVPNRSGC